MGSPDAFLRDSPENVKDQETREELRKLLKQFESLKVSEESNRAAIDRLQQLQG